MRYDVTSSTSTVEIVYITYQSVNISHETHQSII